MVTYNAAMTRRLAALATVGLISLIGQDSPKVKQLTEAEITDALENKKVFFLDVREPKEVTELGTLKGYVNIPIGQLEARLKEIPKDRLILTA
jgi:predicted sulfurtransferase